MSFSKACCTLPPVESSYTPQGSQWKLGDLTIYETPDKTPKRVLICIYDIFGFHPNTMQFCDRLGQAGFRVVMPDVFRGNPYPTENFPPDTWDELKAWVMTKGSWPNVVKPDLLNIIQHYKDEGATSFGIFGLCFGGKMSCLASAELEDIKAAGLIHPSMIEDKEADDVKCPMILIPTKDEPDMIPFYKKLQERWGESCKHVRFDDIFHGFAGARGNLEDELNRKRVDDAIKLIYDFCDEHVK